jgi:hypothetical protein
MVCVGPQHHRKIRLIPGDVGRFFVVVERSKVIPQLPLCCILPTIITYAIYGILCSSPPSSQVGLVACPRLTTAQRTIKTDPFIFVWAGIE